MRQKNLITNLLKFENMRKSLTFLLAFLMLGTVAFSQKTIKAYHDPYTQKNIKEQYTVNSKGLQDGNYKQWNKDGILLMDYNFSNGQKNGKCVDYYSFGEYGGGVHCSGQPLVIEYYTNGEPTGTHTSYKCIDGKTTILTNKTVYNAGKYTQTFYYPNGKIKAVYSGIRRNRMNCNNGQYIAYYENGNTRTKGEYKDKGGNYESVKFGKWIHYYEDGRVLGEENYDDWGKPLGKFIEMDNNGNVVADGEYKAGSLFWGKLFGFYENGNKRFIVDVENISSNDKNLLYEKEIDRFVNKINGKLLYWNENGEKVLEREYINGQFSKEWYPNGQMKEETDYTQKPPVYKAYSEKGVLLVDAKVKEDYYVGKYTEYFDNSIIKSVGNYNDNGAQIGDWWQFKENGEFDYLITYDKDGKQNAKETKTELQKKGIPVLSSLFAGRYIDFRTMTTKEITVRGGSAMYPTYSTKIEYPYGKYFYLKCNILFEDYSEKYLSETDTDKKSIILKEYNSTLDKLLSYKIQDAELIDKQLKKAKTVEDIKTILGL